MMRQQSHHSSFRKTAFLTGLLLFLILTSAYGFSVQSRIVRPGWPHQKAAHSSGPTSSSSLVGAGHGEAFPYDGTKLHAEGRNAFQNFVAAFSSNPGKFVQADPASYRNKFPCCVLVGGLSSDEVGDLKDFLADAEIPLINILKIPDGQKISDALGCPGNFLVDEQGDCTWPHALYQSPLSCPPPVLILNNFDSEEIRDFRDGVKEFMSQKPAMALVVPKVLGKEVSVLVDEIIGDHQALNNPKQPRLNKNDNDDKE